jgi:hypothetical protein
MRVFLSLILRLFFILSVTSVMSLILMVITLYIQKEQSAMAFTGLVCSGLLIWTLINGYLIKLFDPEISAEVAKVLFPSGAILAVCLSFVFALQLDFMIPGTEGKQHFVIPFVGLGVAIYLLVRCFDIKWLRAEVEVRKIRSGDTD